ncbi:MAG: SAM-dependent DNA methyltransferase [Chloroflexota bacterium]|nr:SAM-dependent DNA methyltransferase [Chloroflexota bacterium]
MQITQRRVGAQKAVRTRDKVTAEKTTGAALPSPGLNRQTDGIERFEEKVAFIWSIAELLRGDYKASDYGKVVLPFVVLRRLDCVLEPTKDKVLAEHAKLKIKNIDPVLRRAAGQSFYNTSKLNFKALLGDPTHLARNLRAYVSAFSANATDILTNFSFDEEIARLDKANLLYKVVAEFAKIDLHPDVVDNNEMGYLFEELIRRFSEQSNEAAGEHFTPREVVRLMVNLLFAPDAKLLKERGALRTMYDPACGTGGMLSVADDHLRSLNPHARLEMFGQELNPESYAICKSDMMLKGQDPGHIHLGNSFSQDGESGSRFDYMLSNPPFGVDWKKVEEVINKEHDERGLNGRFGAGLPRINDGSLLFLQHMIAKMKDPGSGGSRIAIVFNGSPLFTGAPESGESNIRRWIIENDWLEAIVALPEELFYNTGIATYVWILTNRKSSSRKGKVQLIDARSLYQKMKKSLGNKRNMLSAEQIAEITKIHADFAESNLSKILPNGAFGYRRIVIDRPLRVRYEVSAGTIAAFRERMAANDGKGARGKPADAAWVNSAASALERLAGTSTIDKNAVGKLLATEIGRQNGALPKSFERALWEVISVRDEGAPPIPEGDGFRPDPELRTYEDIALDEEISTYFNREVRPHAADAWPSAETPKIGYEIPFTRLFYRYVPPRSVNEIDAEVHALEERILDLLKGSA